ncbi:unnamed protein product, partial [Durusdinium trenchii]
HSEGVGRTRSAGRSSTAEQHYSPLVEDTEHEETKAGSVPDEDLPKVAASKAISVLKKMEHDGFCSIEADSVYGAAVAMPQIARSCGWPGSLISVVIRVYFFTMLNFLMQGFLLSMIGEEQLMMYPFAGQMHLCDFGASIKECPDAPNCKGPMGTTYSMPRLYSFPIWSTRVFVKDSLKAIFPDLAEEIDAKVDPGEYGLESYHCRLARMPRPGGPNWLRYREASKARPLAVAFVTCYGKGSASDLVAQMVVERKARPSLQRNMAFALFSGAYLGIGQHFVYNIAFTRLFGAGMDLRVGMQKVTADLVFHVPFMYLPLYYMFEDTALGVGNPFSGLQRWWNELPGTMAAYAKIFPMFHLFNFTVTPPELRISLIACVSLLAAFGFRNVRKEPERLKLFEETPKEDHLFEFMTSLEFGCTEACVFLFMLAVAEDLKESIGLARTLWRLPSRSDPWISYSWPTWASKEEVKKIKEINELDCVKFHVAGIPTAWKVFYYFFVVLPKFGLWLAVAKSGVHYLMETAGIVDMIVNAMALTFVLEVDEMVFHRFTTSLTKHIMNNIQDLPNFDTNMEDSETDQQALERFKAEEFGTKGWGKLLMCIPWRLIFVLVLQALFVCDYYHENCQHLEDGSWVSKELRLPKVLAYRPIELMFGLLSTDGDPVWKMPSD